MYPYFEELAVSDDVRDVKVAGGNPDAFEMVLSSTAGLPGVRIDRDAFLRKSLGKYCDEGTLRRAIDESPVSAGIDKRLLSKLADDSINFETIKVTAISAAAGIPGGLAMAGTVPADTAQYFGHILRIAQKLAYLYGWPSLFDENGEMDDATKNMLILFVGLMFGVESAGKAVQKVAQVTAAAVVRRLPQQALTKGLVYPMVRKVAVYLGFNMTKSTFAKGVSKAIPVIGGVVSGGLTFATFRPMANRLKRDLASLPTADPSFRPALRDVDDEIVIDVEDAGPEEPRKIE